MFRYILLFASLASVFALTACTTSEKTEDQLLTEKIRAQEPADTPQHIATRAAEAFSGAPGLSAEQKLKLHAVYTRVYSESMAIRRDIGQSKSLLFMTVANNDYKSADVAKLKKKIIALDQRRLNIMFEALEDVQKIVGKGTDTERIYKHFRDYEMPTRSEEY